MTQIVRIAIFAIVIAGLMYLTWTMHQQQLQILDLRKRLNYVENEVVRPEDVHLMIEQNLVCRDDASTPATTTTTTTAEEAAYEKSENEYAQ